MLKVPYPPDSSIHLKLKRTVTVLRDFWSKTCAIQLLAMALVSTIASVPPSTQEDSPPF